MAGIFVPFEICMSSGKVFILDCWLVILAHIKLLKCLHVEDKTHRAVNGYKFKYRRLVLLFASIAA